MISLSIVLLRLALALVLGGAIGLERELNEHQAGMRTNALVSLGSALFTLISVYGFLEILPRNDVNVDPSRVASYVVAGIGFLGAGAIVIRRGTARGLTTAAAIWMVAAIGMACGVGFYWESAIACGLALGILRLLRLLEKRLFPEQLEAILRLRLASGQSVGPLLEQVQRVCDREKLTVVSLRSFRDEERECIELHYRFAKDGVGFRLLAQLRTLEGIDEGSLNLQE